MLLVELVTPLLGIDAAFVVLIVNPIAEVPVVLGIAKPVAEDVGTLALDELLSAKFEELTVLCCCVDEVATLPLAVLLVTPFVVLLALNEQERLVSTNEIYGSRTQAVSQGSHALVPPAFALLPRSTMLMASGIKPRRAYPSCPSQLIS